MNRSFVIALLAFTALVAGWSHAGVDKGKDFVVKGKLTKDDNKDAQRGGPAQLHKIASKRARSTRSTWSALRWIPICDCSTPG